MNLMTSRRFLPLFLTQFFGAFNDNLFKNALAMLITFRLASSNPGSAQLLVTLAAGLFILPYFLFSATAGQLADKYDRAQVVRVTKIWEIIIMTIAAAGFYIGNVYFLLFVLFCLGVQATTFGPVKYALLPQHLNDDQLLIGNSYIEAGMFLAILLGTISGGLLILHPMGEHLISVAMISCAVLGYITSRFIPPAPAPMPQMRVEWNFARETLRVIAHDRKNTLVFNSILGISWFWLVGGTFVSQFPGYAKETLHSDETVVTLFLTMFSLGIGVGSFLCNLLLKGKISLRTVPIGAAGISLFAADLFFASNHAALLPSYVVGTGVMMHMETPMMSAYDFIQYPSNWRILMDLLGIAVCSGLFIVPLYTVMQHASDPAYRARTIATNNILNALFMVGASIGTIVLLDHGVTVPQVFLTIAAINGAVTVWITKLSRGY